jgi:RNA polymerase sigma-70 factor (ECF subfamily)
MPCFCNPSYHARIMPPPASLHDTLTLTSNVLRLRETLMPTPRELRLLLAVEHTRPRSSGGQTTFRLVMSTPTGVKYSKKLYAAPWSYCWGVPTTFSECVLSCHASLYRYARSLCGEPGDAEELLQETYQRALGARAKPSTITIDNIRPWLFTIMRRVWQNERRRKSRMPETVLDEDTEALFPESPETQLSQKTLVSEVRAAVDSMPVAWREIVVLRDIENLSYAEIATVLGCPIGTVMSRLSRARVMLRERLTSRHSVAWKRQP